MMTGSIWALAVVFCIAAGLCLWAWLTGRPAQEPGQHRGWGETRNLSGYRPRPPDEDRPADRWYDENPWPEEGPHGWGETRD